MKKVLDYAKFYLVLFCNISVLYAYALTGILPIMMLFPIGIILLFLTLNNL